MGTLTEAFDRFTGGLPPLLVLLVAAFLAVVLLWRLGDLGFQVWRSGPHTGLIYGPALAAGLAVVMVAVDIASPYPADLNVPFPASLVFYPAIGFVAEVAFHLLPLTVLLLALGPLTPRLGTGRAAALAIAGTALVEPLFQLALTGPGGYPVWQLTYMTVHIYVFSVVQLWLFRRYDFVSMYVTRLVYYLIWHVVWGSLRLDLLY